MWPKESTLQTLRYLADLFGIRTNREALQCFLALLKDTKFLVTANTAVYMQVSDHFTNLNLFSCFTPDAGLEKSGIACHLYPEKPLLRWQNNVKQRVTFKQIGSAKSISRNRLIFDLHPYPPTLRQRKDAPIKKIRWSYLVESVGIQWGDLLQKQLVLRWKSHNMYDWFDGRSWRHKYKAA